MKEQNRYFEYLNGIQRILEESGARSAYKEGIKEGRTGNVWRGGKDIVVVDSLQKAKALKKKLEGWAKSFKVKDTDKPYSIRVNIGQAEDVCNIAIYSIAATQKGLDIEKIVKMVQQGFNDYNRRFKKEEDMLDPKETIIEVMRTLSREKKYTVSFYKPFAHAYRISYYDPSKEKRIQSGVGDVFILYNEEYADSIRVEKMEVKRKKRHKDTIIDRADYELMLFPDVTCYIIEE